MLWIVKLQTYWLLPIFDFDSRNSYRRGLLRVGGKLDAIRLAAFGRIRPQMTDNQKNT